MQYARKVKQRVDFLARDNQRRQGNCVTGGADQNTLVEGGAERVKSAFDRRAVSRCKLHPPSGRYCEYR